MSKVRAFNDFPSRSPYNLRPELFEFEFQATFSITKASQRLQQPANVHGCSATVYASTSSKATGQLSLVEKSAILVLCAFFVLWLVRPATKSIFTLVPFACLVWSVSGGFHMLEQQHQSTQPSLDEDHDVCFEVHPTGDIAPSIEAIILNRNTAHEKTKVPRWLASFRNMSTSSDCWMSSLKNEENPSLASGIPPSVQAKPHCEIVADEDAVEAVCSNDDQIAAPQRQYGNPVFNDTNQWAPGGPLYYQRMASCLEPIFISDDGQSYEDVDAWSGRPTKADALDIAFLLDVLEPHLMEDLKVTIGAQSLDTIIMTRSQNGENALLQELEMQWLLICPGNIAALGSPIKTLQDI
ncbi:hypothetical protein J4E91_008952 [Alternaria rosae]|nr:hypothetical protein J4E91_008952 [Alternaria rosae]